MGKVKVWVLFSKLASFLAAASKVYD